MPRPPLAQKCLLNILAPTLFSGCLARNAKTHHLLNKPRKFSKHFCVSGTLPGGRARLPHWRARALHSPGCFSCQHWLHPGWRTQATLHRCWQHPEQPSNIPVSLSPSFSTPCWHMLSHMTPYQKYVTRASNLQTFEVSGGWVSFTVPELSPLWQIIF